MRTSEKIETIALCRSSGEYGQFVEYSPGKYRVTADGLTVLVRCGEVGWHVFFRGFEAVDGSLIEAARMALNEGAKYGFSRDFNIDPWL